MKQLLEPAPEELVDHYPNQAEHSADWWVHAVGLAAAIIGGIILVVWSMERGGLSFAGATSLYAACLIVMLAASAVYNLTHPSPARRLLRRLDEAAIFLLIAGSYTPFTALRFEGAWAVGMTGLVWALAFAGVAGKLFRPDLSERFWCLVYVGFGWLAVVAFQPLITTVPLQALALLAAGGLLYTIGVPFFLRQSLPYRRAIWHCFVVAGASAHYAAVLTGVVLA